jgi:maltokinase
MIASDMGSESSGSTLSGALTAGVAAGASASVANRVAPRLIPLPSATERPINRRRPKVGPANVSIVVDETVVVKWLHTPSPVPHRGAQVWAHLAEVGFDEMPMFHGVDEMDRQVVALLTSFVPDADDGWSWYVDLATEELSSGGFVRSVGLASRLGGLTARLHEALSTPSSVIPLPVGWGDTRAEYDRGMAALDRAVRAPGGPIGTGLTMRYDDIADAIGTLSIDRHVDVQRIHGDLHVGRMLRTRDRIMVIGFDDAPVEESHGRGVLRSPMVDLATLVQSVDHVGRVVAVRVPECADHVDEFIAEATDALVGSYGRTATVDADVLGALRTIRELEDYEYAARHLPRWLGVPYAALCARHPLEGRGGNCSSAVL